MSSEASMISGGSSHFERKRHTVGVIIEPTPQEHINMVMHVMIFFFFFFFFLLCKAQNVDSLLYSKINTPIIW
jgi:hypothetical protein